MKSADPVQPLTPTQALRTLLEGNRRFVDGHSTITADHSARRQEVSREQHPFAAVFGCSDSRVPAEFIFDRGLGDLFVIRTAGHSVGRAVLSSIEFAVDVLNIPLIVILGHDRCGALSAAVNALEEGHGPGGYLGSLVDQIVPVAKQVRDSPPEAPLHLGTEWINHTSYLLRHHSESVRKAVAVGKTAIVGMRYRLDDGQVNVVAHTGKALDVDSVTQETGHLR